MIVTCENCSTSFTLDERLVKSTGSKVRCSKCKHIFVTYPQKPSEEEMPKESVDLEPDIEGDSDAGAADDSGLMDEQTADETLSEAADLDFSDEQTADETSSDMDEPEDMDLSDIEKMLEVEEDAEDESEAEDDSSLGEPDDDASEDSLDLSDFEKILDEETPGDELVEDKTDEDEDLVFDLDEALEEEAGEEQISPTSELDLGDLEKMFESEEEEPDFSLEDEPVLSDESDFSLEDELSPPEESGADDSDQELLTIEDKDLEIEMEEETPAPETEEREEVLHFDMEEDDEASQTPSEEEAQELEFDLEEVGEDSPESTDAEAADKEVPDSDDEMDLQIEMEEEAESDAVEIESSELSMEGEAESSAPETEELALSMDDEVSESDDLEGVLETEETTDDFLESITDVEEEKIGEETTEDVLGGPQEEVSDGSDDEVPDEELSDLDEEAEIDFPDDAVPEIPDEEDSFTDEEEPPQEEEFEETEDVTEEISIQQPAKEKSGLVKFVVWLLVIVAIIVIALGTLLFLQSKGKVHIPFLDRIELPFLGKLSVPDVPDAGNMKIGEPSDVDARFLDGGKAGKLFIVTGKVKNNYENPRSFIQVSGSLYTRGAMLAQTVKAYCGNVLPDLELSKMDASEIQARMENRSGESNSNVGVEPGEELPFMIVFSDFPESLEEYTVTVLSSSAAGE